MWFYSLAFGATKLVFNDFIFKESAVWEFFVGLLQLDITVKELVRICLAF